MALVEQQRDKITVNDFSENIKLLQNIQHVSTLVGHSRHDISAGQSSADDRSGKVLVAVAYYGTFILTSALPSLTAIIVGVVISSGVANKRVN